MSEWRRREPKKVLPVGKLPLEQLRSLLRHLPKHDPRLLIGPQIGEDAAVIDAGDRYLVVATDPITFATDHIEVTLFTSTRTTSLSWARARCGSSSSCSLVFLEHHRQDTIWTPRDGLSEQSSSLLVPDRFAITSDPQAVLQLKQSSE